MRVVVVLLAWCVSAVAISAQAPLPFADRLEALRHRMAAHAYDDAEALAQSVREDAANAGDLVTATLATRMLAGMRMDQERFADARRLLVGLIDQAREAGLRQRELEATLMLSRIRSIEGDADGAASDARSAMDAFETLEGVAREQLVWAYGQALAALVGRPGYDAEIRRATASLRPEDRFPAACHLWQSRGDHEFNTARYVEAHESLTTALACYEGGPQGGDAGRVLVSLGRVQRAHGQLHTALEYYRRAARLQKADGDIPALLQSLNAQAVTYDRLGQYGTAERMYRQALAQARAHGLERYEVFLQGNLGGSLLRAGRAAAGLRELEAVLPRERNDSLRATRLRQIAEARLDLGQPDKALAAIEEAGRLLPAPTFDERMALLYSRAMVNARLGNLEIAQRDLDEAVRMVEEARARVIDGDVTRTGFGDFYQQLFGVAIDIAMRRGEPRAALELAEQARARALLDLMRQGTADESRWTPPRVAGMQALARDLDTTLLVYWVGRGATYAWVVSPESVRGERLAIGERRLRELVRAAAGSGDVPRAVNAALLAGPDLDAWRSLHRSLVAPVKTALPTRVAARLTIVPHGPLLHLPFAGLLDTSGRHMIERYTLHYAPSVAVLQAAMRQTTPGGAARMLVLGDPSPLPRVAGLQLPPPLPHAREEARRIARRFTAGTVLTVGDAATERTLRAQVDAFGWLHVATHARVSEEETADSYLLLARGSGEPTDDGRLTAEEVRSLPLAGTTIVLSACGTALGRVTGEGTLGFTRSFLAAGARAIVATTWAMPDTAGLRVMDAFYAARAAGAGVSEALRAAQLRTLRALRAGSVKARAGSQVVTLPATPLLWAGYVAVGAP